MPKKILVIEDDVFLLNTYGAKLRKEGYEVFLMENGNLLKNTLKSFFPDIVLLDLLMPGKDGFTLIKELKSNSETANIPIIVVSRLSSTEDKDKTLSLGASAHIVKAESDYSQIKEVLSKQLL